MRAHPESSDIAFISGFGASALLLAGRALTAAGFMAVSLGEIFHYDEILAAAAPSLGAGAAKGHLIFSAGAAFAGSVLLVLGLKTRAGVFLLLATVAQAGWLFYALPTGTLNIAGLIAVAGGLLALFATGPGRFSMDAGRGARGPEARRYVR